jgi:hypothetical protein
LLAAILGVVVSYTVYSSKTDVSLSDLALENVEALASGEGGGSYDCCNTCKGAFCGTFYPANGTGVGISVYYKI